MTTQTFIAAGSTFERSIDGKTTWQALPEAKAIPLPEVQQEYVDVTNLDSGGAREYIAGLIDIGEFSIPFNYTRAGFQLLKTDMDAGVAVDYRVTLPNGDVFEFAGIPTVALPGTEAPDAIGMTLTIRGSGNFTFTPGP